MLHGQCFQIKNDFLLVKMQTLLWQILYHNTCKETWQGYQWNVLFCSIFYFFSISSAIYLHANLCFFNVLVFSTFMFWHYPWLLHCELYFLGGLWKSHSIHTFVCVLYINITLILGIFPLCDCDCGWYNSKTTCWFPFEQWQFNPRVKYAISAFKCLPQAFYRG